MLYCKGRGESFVTPFLCFVVIRQTSTSANKKSRQWAVRKVQPIVGIFAERKYLQPSDNKTVCIVPNFCSLLTTKRFVSCQIFAAFWQQNGLWLCWLFRHLPWVWNAYLYKSYSVDSFYPFRTLLTFDILARKSPIFFICYTKSIPSIVNILKALCKKMRKKNHTMRK